jgi:hypothetical protein
MSAALLKKSAGIALVLLGPALLVGWAAGTRSILVYTMSVMLGVAASAVVKDERLITLGAMLTVAFFFAAAVNGSPLPVAIVVALAALASIPAEQVSAGMFSMLPALAAVIGIVPVSGSAPVVGLVAAAGFAYAWLITTLAGVSSVPAPAPPELARVHGIVLGTVTALGAWATLAWNVPHGYWFVLTIAVILRPQPDEAREQMHARMAGTMLGAFAALVLLYVLPGWLVTVAILVAALLFFAYLQSGDPLRQTISLTTMLLLLSAAGVEQAGIEASLERILWTAVAIVVAAAIYSIARGVAERRAQTGAVG